MTFDHHFGYSFPLFSSLNEEKANELAKLEIKIHAFQPCLFISGQSTSSYKDKIWDTEITTQTIKSLSFTILIKDAARH